MQAEEHEIKQMYADSQKQEEFKQIHAEVGGIQVQKMHAKVGGIQVDVGRSRRNYSRCRQQIMYIIICMQKQEEFKQMYAEVGGIQVDACRSRRNSSRCMQKQEELQQMQTVDYVYHYYTTELLHYIHIALLYVPMSHNIKQHYYANEPQHKSLNSTIIPISHNIEQHYYTNEPPHCTYIALL